MTSLMTGSIGCQFWTMRKPLMPATRVRVTLTFPSFGSPRIAENSGLKLRLPAMIPNLKSTVWRAKHHHASESFRWQPTVHDCLTENYSFKRLRHYV